MVRRPAADFPFLPRRDRAVVCGLVLALLAPATLRASDGDPDLGFGLFGKAVRGLGTARAVVARADGSLRLAINRSWNVGFLALTENGAIDATFGDGGVKMVDLPTGFTYNDNAEALFERPDGRLLMLANTDDYRQGALIQVTADGELDPDFGTDGVRLFTHGSEDVRAYAAALLSDGKVLVAGMCFDCGPTTGGDTFVARYTELGGLDTAFGTNGWAIFDAVEGGTAYDHATAMAVDGLGRILVGGTAGTNPDDLPFVARRLSNGAVDVSFAGADGIRTLTALTAQHVTGLAIEPGTHRVVVSTGDRQNGAPDTCAIARLRDTGSLDTTFSGDGIAPLTVEEGSNLHSVRLQSDGKIVAAGSLDPDLGSLEGFLLVRLLDTGELDTTFDDDGRKVVEFDLDSNGRDSAIALTLAGGRPVAAGFAVEGGANQVAIYRGRSTLVFTDGFERGTTAGWLGN